MKLFFSTINKSLLINKYKLYKLSIWYDYPFPNFLYLSDYQHEKLKYKVFKNSKSLIMSKKIHNMYNDIFNNRYSKELIHKNDLNKDIIFQNLVIESYYWFLDPSKISSLHCYTFYMYKDILDNNYHFL